MQRKMAKASKTRASKLPYLSIKQLTLEGFETPFEKKLNADNRWVLLSKKIPWDDLVGVYNKQMRNYSTGASNINGRVIIGALMIKHLNNFSDEETILQIQENMYMQYFIGYSSYSNETPFDSSLFVEIRKRLGHEQLNEMTQKIYNLFVSMINNNDKNTNDPSKKVEVTLTKTEEHSANVEENKSQEKTISEENNTKENTTHKGRLLVDATACPQDIAYPTDLNILNDSREKSEMLIDVLYCKEIHGNIKPRTYRKEARKRYLQTAQSKKKTKKNIRKAIGIQLRYVKRNINHITKLLEAYQCIPLDENQYKYLLVIQEAYRQQNQMYVSKTHSIEHRIVSIHQPHVRPIVRGKEKAKTEFGAKTQISLINDFAFIDELSWDAFNEGTILIETVEKYKTRTGFYPEEVLADKIYCTRDNRKDLKMLGVKLIAKPLGRPSAVNKEHVRPGERNPIEGKFGQAKTKYGLDRIRARLNDTSESWIASIFLVLNLVKLAGQVPYCLLLKFIELYLNPGFRKRSISLLFQ